MSNTKVFSTIPEALEELRQGKPVIVLDDEDRENEGDLIYAAEKVTAEDIMFMRLNGTGIICAPFTAARASELSLPIMVTDSTDPNKTAYTVGTDAQGTSTGVSGSDMALTMNALANGEKKAQDFRKPGHVFPLIAKPHGVVQRRGHTEAGADLCRLAGLQPVATIVELINNIHNCPEGEDRTSSKYRCGEMMRLDDCVIFAKKHDLKLITIEQLVKYRYETEPGLKEKLEGGDLALGVELAAECRLPVQPHFDFLGDFRLQCIYSHYDRRNHDVLIMGDVSGDQPPLVRVHSECFTGDVLGSQRCDCRWQLIRSQEIIAEKGRGILIYYSGHEGRGIGKVNKVKAYDKQQREGKNTYEANHALGFKDDLRTYETAKDILKLLGVKKFILMTSNGDKAAQFGDMVVDVMALEGPMNIHNKGYLEAKRAHPGHISRSESPELTSKDSDSESSSDSWTSSSSKVIPHLSVFHGKEKIKSAPVEIPVVEHPETYRVGLVSTMWNQALVKSFAGRVKELLLKNGIKSDKIIEVVVDGSNEIPWAAKKLTAKVDVVIAMGLILQGESDHYADVRAGVYPALVNIGVDTGVLVVNGVYSCKNEQQALERYGPHSGKDVCLVAAALRPFTLKL